MVLEELEKFRQPRREANRDKVAAQLKKPQGVTGVKPATPRQIYDQIHGVTEADPSSADLEVKSKGYQQNLEKQQRRRQNNNGGNPRNRLTR